MAATILEYKLKNSDLELYSSAINQLNQVASSNDGCEFVVVSNKDTTTVTCLLNGFDSHSIDFCDSLFK